MTFPSLSNWFLNSKLRERLASWKFSWRSWLSLVPGVREKTGGNASGKVKRRGLLPTMELLETRMVPANTIGFSNYNYEVNEGVGTAYLTVDFTRDPGNSDPVSANVVLFGGGTAFGGGRDYTFTSTPVSFTDGSTSQNVSVTIVDDNVDEFDETIMFQFTDVSNACVVLFSLATVTIIDNDDAPKASFQAPRFEAQESAGSATITVVLDRASEKEDIYVRYYSSCCRSIEAELVPDPMPIVYAPSPGDDAMATGFLDYTPTLGKLKFDVGTLSTPGQTVATFSLQLHVDDVEEGPEKLNVYLAKTPPEGASVYYAQIHKIPEAILYVQNNASPTYDEYDRLISVTFTGGASKSWTYYSGDLLESFTNELGGITTYTYDGNGHLASVTDPTNVTTTYVIASDGTLTSLTLPDPDGAGPLGVTTTTYTYDNGRLTSILFPDLNRNTYSYDARGNLLTETNELNHTTTYTYDSANRLETKTDPMGGVTTYSYSANTRAVIDPLGRVTTTQYDINGNVISLTSPDPDGGGPLTAPVVAYTYNTLGQVTTEIDPLGNVTTFTYDGDNRPQTIQRPDPDGGGPLVSAVTTFIYDLDDDNSTVVDPSGAVTTTTYDFRGRVVSTIDPSGAVTTYSYDLAGRLVAVAPQGSAPTTTVYDLAGRVIAEIDVNDKRTTTVYDGRGNVWATIDPYGFRTTIVYDSRDRQIATIDSYGHAATVVYDAASRVVNSIDVFNNVSTFVYDAANRLTESIDSFGNRSTTVYNIVGETIVRIDPYDNRTTIVYDAMGRSIATIDPDNQVTTTIYDAASRVVETIDPHGQRTTYVYDNAGQLTQLIDPFGHTATTVYDSAGRTVASIDVYGHATTYLYDAANRPHASIDIYGHRVTTVYNAANQVEARIDVFGQAVTYTYDFAGRLETTRDSLNNVSTTVYDSFGRVEATIDPLGHRSTTVYDNRGRLEATIDPLNHRTTTLYDAFGRPHVTMDARDFATTIVYDSLGRAEATIDALGNRATTVYDNRGRASATIDALDHRTTTLYDTRGRYQGTTDALNHTTTIAYDSHGRQNVTINALGHRTTIVYDDRGRYSATIDALNHRATVAYDAYGRHAASIDPLGNAVTTTYDGFGRVSTTIDPLNQITTTVYDSHGRHVATIDALSGRVTYAYDTHNRRVSVKDPVNNTTTSVYDTLGREIETIDPLGQSATFAYDALGRLASATDRLDRRRDFTYDEVGNKTGETWIAANGYTVNDRVTFTYDAANNQLTAQNQWGTHTLTYDALNRVVTSSQPAGVSLTFTYDAVGNRTHVGDSNGAVEVSSYDALNQLVTRHLHQPGPANNTVSVHMFEDWDGNGSQDGSEPDLSGICVILYSAGTQDSLDYVYTDASGNATFNTSLEKYQVLFGSPAGMTIPVSQGMVWHGSYGSHFSTPTVEGSQSWTLGYISTPSYTAPDYSSQSISLYFYGDDNENGYQDGSESGLSNVCVYLSHSNGFDEAYSDSSGYASLSSPFGPYILGIAPNTPGYTLPPDAVWDTYYEGGYYAYTGSLYGGVSLGVGLRPVLPGSGGQSVSGHFFDDVDGDGIQDSGEADVPDVTISILQHGIYDPFNSSSTDSSGDFSFTSPKGPYYLSFEAPSGFYFPASDEFLFVDAAGTLVDTDTHAGARSWNVGLRSSTQSTGSGSGGTVSGSFYTDDNANGVKDLGEAAVSGSNATVNIHSVTPSGISWFGTATVDSSGNFSRSAPAGTYFLSVTYSSGTRVLPIASGFRWDPGSFYGQGGASTVLVQGTSTWNLGLVPYPDNAGGSLYLYGGEPDPITGQLFDDADGDGTWDVGESGLANQTVEVVTVGGSTFDSAVTDSSGNYILNYPDDFYSLRFTASAGRALPTNAGLAWGHNQGHFAYSQTYSGPQSIGAIGVVDEEPPQLGIVDLRVAYAYDEAGRLTSIQRYTDIMSYDLVARTTYAYDPAGRVTRLWTQDVENDTVADFQYAYDAFGRLWVKTEDGVVTTYAYDATNQLTGEDFATGTEGAYTYDANGNRTMTGYATGDDNQLASDGTWEYTYDAEGNMTGKEAVSGTLTWDYHYDHRNQLVRADRKTNGTTIDLTVEYKYDAWGNRIEKSVDTDGLGILNPEVLKFALDGWNPAKRSPIGLENVDVWADLGIDGSLKTRYLRGDEIDELIARIDDAASDPKPYWYLTDHLGSIRKGVDDTGTIKNAITYDAFGNILAESDSAYRGRYAWTGREIEVETGLQYNRARYYDPAIGRWISKDPLGFGAGDSNLYRYVNNAPTNAIDPSGLDFIAVGGRPAAGSVFGHLSLEYWATSFDPELNKSWTKDELLTKASACIPAPTIKGIEVLVDSQRQAYAWTYPFDPNEKKFDFSKPRVWDSSPVGVMFIQNTSTAKDVVPIVKGSAKDVRATWDALLQTAASYKFAEQPGWDKDPKGSTVTNWPNSYYPTYEPRLLELLVKYTTSNTFVRYLLSQNNLSSSSSPGNRLYPGNPTPVSIPHGKNIQFWTYKEQKPWKFGIIVPDQKLAPPPDA